MLTPWRIYAASAIGKSHIDGGLPCQDAFGHAPGENGFLVAAVCDGAGSVSHSATGAKACADFICTFLAASTCDPATVCDQNVIEKAIEGARGHIEQCALELSVAARELACTLVGAVLFEQGGCLFHIGDGMAVVDLTEASPVLSLPENGEYANETYFVTGEDWRAHLRITPFTGKIHSLALMSDGAMPFVINREKTGFFRPFIDPVKSYLTTVSEAAGSEALESTLADEKTWSITSDDKTLLLILP
jgi:hypothetical protein